MQQSTYVGCAAFAPCKWLCVENMTLACKRLIAYVYDLCARGDLCIRCTSFARKQLIAYVVRLSTLQETYCVRCTSFALWATYSSGSDRPIIQWLRMCESCGHWTLVGPSNCAMTEIARWLTVTEGSSGSVARAMTGIVGWLDLNRLITVRSCDDFKDYNRSITVR